MKKTEKLTFRCTKELKQTLECKAKKRNMKQTDYIEHLIYADNLDDRRMDYASVDKKIQDLWYSQIQDREDIRTLCFQVRDVIQNASESLTKENQDILLLSLKNIFAAYTYNAEKREAALEEIHETMPVSKVVLFERG